MPGFDGTGPQSCGPMTGGGQGYCAPGNRGVRMGFAGGRMNRRGFRGGFRGNPNQGFRNSYGCGRGQRGARSYMMPLQADDGYVSQDDELNHLRDEANDLKMMLSNVESRIQKLEGNTSSEG